VYKKWEKAEHCFQRSFCNNDDVTKFFRELTTGMLEGLCSCVSEDVNHLLEEERTLQCDRVNVHFESQKYLYMSLSRYERRSLQEIKFLSSNGKELKSGK
jgi:hypothetical protein